MLFWFGVDAPGPDPLGDRTGVVCVKEERDLLCRVNEDELREEQKKVNEWTDG